SAHYASFDYVSGGHCDLLSSPTRRSSDLRAVRVLRRHLVEQLLHHVAVVDVRQGLATGVDGPALAQRDHLLHQATGLLGPRLGRSEEHTSELQSRENLVCRLLLVKKTVHS